MRYRIYIVLTLILLAVSGWYLSDYLLWRQAYVGDGQKPSIWPHVMIMIPGLLMLAVVICKRHISSIAFYGSIVCTALAAAGITTGLTYSDNVGGGLTMLLLAFPGAIVLSILALMELQEIMPISKA